MQGSGHFAIAANSIEGRDARWHLHPNTDARQHERTGPLMIVRGSGFMLLMAMDAAVPMMVAISADTKAMSSVLTRASIMVALSNIWVYH